MCQFQHYNAEYLSRGGSLRERDEGMSGCPGTVPLLGLVEAGSWLSWAVEAEDSRGI